MLLFCSDVGGTFRDTPSGRPRSVLKLKSAEWSERAARSRVLAKTAAVLVDGWTLELVNKSPFALAHYDAFPTTDTANPNIVVHVAPAGRHARSQATA